MVFGLTGLAFAIPALTFALVARSELQTLEQRVAQLESERPTA